VPAFSTFIGDIDCPLNHIHFFFMPTLSFRELNFLCIIYRTISLQIPQKHKALKI